MMEDRQNTGDTIYLDKDGNIIEKTVEIEELKDSGELSVTAFNSPLITDN